MGQRALAQVLARNAGALLYYGVSALQRRGAVKRQTYLHIGATLLISSTVGAHGNSIPSVKI